MFVGPRGMSREFQGDLRKGKKHIPGEGTRQHRGEAGRGATAGNTGGCRVERGVNSGLGGLQMLSSLSFILATQETQEP